MTGIADVVFIGGGYRTVSFLGATPWLLERAVTVVERTASFGGGAYSDYDCTSTSEANRFFGKITADVVSRADHPDRIRDLQSGVHPLPLHEVAAAMEDVGRGVERSMGPDRRILRETNVQSVDVAPDHVTVRTDKGEERARLGIVATGRHEVPHPGLGAWAAKTILSSRFISRSWSADIRARVAATNGAVVIVGGSHSAVAALDLVLRTRRSLGRESLPVRILQRSGVRFHYPDLETAYSRHDPAVEAPIDALENVCPATGQVNRDSGLRGTGRQLYAEVVAGRVPDVSVVRVADLGDARAHLDAAGLVVQALGYRGDAPPLTFGDGTGRTAGSTLPLLNLPDGTAVVGRRVLPSLSVLRVEPTPRALRDHALYGQTLYQAMADRLRSTLGAA
ncbi:NAD(P)-binding domain-containing protein [Cellulosimicrobium cellulans]|uniref:NAD(P)-binding domain-containing protein n=1 Tax=Cellulosimicrobium cellulans TaxID=1710 RepID=UPI0020CD4349|nr:NAD(P)-binding domain-containing protein [Cellulosimicrobium cellulans]